MNLSRSVRNLPRLVGSSVLLAMIVIPPAIAPLVLGGSPGRGWAPSMTHDMPSEVLSKRYEIRSEKAYRELAGQWRAYLDSHPASAVAHVELARALRYAGTAPETERNQLVRRALELDPDCPEALLAVADTHLHTPTALTGSPEEARLHALRAIELAPSWAEPHFVLWPLAIELGRDEEAEKHLRAAIDKGGFPTPVLDFCHNLLVSTAPDAILLTNGDNDTYPALALQAAYQLRTDVAIVNLSMLNLPAYAASVWQQTFGDDGPFTTAEISSMHRHYERRSAADRQVRFSDRVVSALLDRVRDGRWTRPVYFALTVSSGNLEPCKQTREIEGIAWRVGRELETETRTSGSRINLAHTVRVFQNDFRLDSATDYAHGWTPDDAATPLMRNYSAVLHAIATESAGQNEIEWMRYALREACRLLDFHGERELVRRTAEYWRQADPDSREAERWLSTGEFEK